MQLGLGRVDGAIAIECRGDVSVHMFKDGVVGTQIDGSCVDGLATWAVEGTCAVHASSREGVARADMDPTH
jgi:hypothetical protein